VVTTSRGDEHHPKLHQSALVERARDLGHHPCVRGSSASDPHVGDLARTPSLDSDVALGPRTSDAGVAPEAAHLGAVRPGASVRAWQLAQANLRGIALGQARVAPADVRLTGEERASIRHHGAAVGVRRGRAP